MSDARQLPLPLPHSERLTAEDFMVTDSNRAAAAWIGKWPDWSGPCLILYGPAGSGKTHLAEVWRQASHAETLDLSLEEAEGRYYILEDANEIAGNPTKEERLFHLFNRLKDSKGSLLLTASAPPLSWNIRLPDLRSRLLASPAIALEEPDDALIAAMLIKQFRDRQIQVEAGVIDYLTPRIERTPSFIRDLVQRLDEASLAAGRKITIVLAREMLKSEG
jgi:DnaA regulatory inactivator Hda